MKKIKELQLENGKPFLAADAAIIQEYERILRREQKKFTNGTWAKPGAEHYASTVLRYIIEGKLNLTLDELLAINAREFRTKWRINGLIQHVYGNSFQNAVLAVYGDHINAWEFQTAHHYLNNDAVKHEWLDDFFNQHLKSLTKEEVIEFFTTVNLRDNHAKLFNYFNGSPYDCYMYFHKHEYFSFEIAPHEFEIGHTKIWDETNNITALLRDALKKESIQDKEGLIAFLNRPNSNSVLKGATRVIGYSKWELYEFMFENGLTTISLQPYEMKVVPNYYYRSDLNKVNALKWFIFEKLQLTTKELFVKHFSIGVVAKHMRGLTEELETQTALFDFLLENNILPWTVYPWELKFRPQGFWDEPNMMADAITWFFEIQLQQTAPTVNSFKVSDMWAARLKELYLQRFGSQSDQPKQAFVEFYYNTREQSRFYATNNC